MNRTTRSKRTFSSWACVPCANPEFELVSGLRDAIFKFDGHDEPEEFESSDLGEPSAPHLPPVQPPMHGQTTLTRKQKLKAASRAREKKKKQDPTRGSRPVSAKIQDRYPERAPPIRLAHLSIEDSSVACTGFVALNDVPHNDRIYTLQEATGEGSILNFTFQEWNGSDPMVVVDKNGIICAVLAGHPNDPDWDSIHREAALSLETRRHRCSIPPEKLTHRRGAFATLTCGVSHGGGQPRPMNLKNEGVNKEVIDELNGMECFTRIANFGSAVTMRRAPKLYNYYAENLKDLQEWEPDLRRPFPSSVYSCVAYNFGPRTVCYEHKDFGNNPPGWCPVTPLGLFDYTKGGHLILWECHLVIEFPAGSTILLPSAIIAHSNCAIGREETRYSFTQFTAGALFRWANNQHKRTIDFHKSLSKAERDTEEEKNEKRWKETLTLLPRFDAADVVDNTGEPSGT